MRAGLRGVLGMRCVCGGCAGDQALLRWVCACARVGVCACAGAWAVGVRGERPVAVGEREGLASGRTHPYLAPAGRVTRPPAVGAMEGRGCPYAKPAFTYGLRSLWTA
jgi:hypothetical protein